VTEAEAPALVLQTVCAAYGPYRALFDVSFVVPRGGIVALLGSNGAGKSTVARVASGLLPSTSGTIQIDGQDVTGKPAHKIAQCGMSHVPEGRGIFSSLSVEENLVLSFRQRSEKKLVGESLEKAFQAFPILKERRKQIGGTLSGGQQRLLSLAKILVLPPKLLVADELSLGLAPVVVDSVYEGLSEIAKAGTALLVVEQHVDRALSFANDAVVLEHGSVAFQGPSKGALKAVEDILIARGEHTPIVGGTPSTSESGEEH
jgi:branched-chain amino acid transport system ATP-binding protein